MSSHTVSMNWPKSLLSASNRKLVSEAEELTTKLTQKAQACEEARDALVLMKENAARARKMIAIAEKELARERQMAEKATSEARIMQLANEKTAKELAQWEAEAARLRGLSRQAEEALSGAHRALTTEIDLAAFHEDEAKAALAARVARERKGEALEAEMARLSSQVWSRLSHLNEEVARRQSQLQGSRDELAHVLKELDGVRRSLRATVQDQHGTLQELAHVQAECSAADHLILVNSETMQALQDKAAAKTGLKARLERTMAAFQLDAKVARKASEAKRAAYEKKLDELRRHIEELKRQTGALDSIQRQCRAETQHRQNLIASATNAETLAEERRASVQQHREYRQQLQELVKALERDAVANPVPSPAAMLATHSTLQRQLARWEDRLERAQRRMSAAVSEMIREGGRGEETQAALTRTQLAAARINADHASQAAVLKSVTESADMVSAELSKRKELLPELKAVSLMQFDQRRKQCEAKISEMRERLTEATNGYRRLLQANTALRASLRRTKEALREQEATFNDQAESGALLLGEVPSLEKELNNLAQRCTDLAENYARAQLTFTSLTAAADGQVDAMKQVAGLEDVLRAEMVAQESSLEADMQTALVELHLHQTALREQGEELRRQARRRDLLRSRYEELMHSLTRAATAPLVAEGATADEGRGLKAPAPLLPSLGPLDENAAPEALHARLLLQRSYERERLMEKGNYLDLRLVSLDRETATLRGMLDALKRESAKNPSQRTVAAAMDSVGESRGGGGPTGALSLMKPNTSSAPKSLSLPASCPGDDRAQLAQVELTLQEAALEALHEQRELSRNQLKSMRKTLQELQGVEKQKRHQLQRMQTQLQRARQSSVHQDCKKLKGRSLPTGANAPL